MRPIGFVFFALSMFTAAGCREQLVLDASSDRALQSSLGRLAGSLPESQRKSFVEAVLSLAFSDAELKDFEGVKHDRKAGVAYIPAGSHVLFRKWNGLSIEQLAAALKEKPKPTPPKPAPEATPQPPPPPPGATVPPASPATSEKLAPSPQVAALPKKANPFEGGTTSTKDNDEPPKEKPVEPKAKPEATPPAAKSENVKPKPEIPKPKEPTKPEIVGRLVPIAALGSPPIPAGKTPKQMQEFEDLRDDGVRKKWIEDGDVILLTEPTEVTVETVNSGWVYCRRVDPTLKNRLLVVREKYLVLK